MSPSCCKLQTSYKHRLKLLGGLHQAQRIYLTPGLHSLCPVGFTVMIQSLRHWCSRHTPKSQWSRDRDSERDNREKSSEIAVIAHVGPEAETGTERAGPEHTPHQAAARCRYAYNPWLQLHLPANGDGGMIVCPKDHSSLQRNPRTRQSDERTAMIACILITIDACVGRELAFCLLFMRHAGILGS